MQESIGQTESRIYARTRKSTHKLLARLHAAHSGEPAPALIDPDAAPKVPNAALKWANEILCPRSLSQIENIQRMVATCFPGVDVNDIRSQRRTAKIVRPRQIAMYLAKMNTGRSLPEIGRRFGGRDHTTVLHAVRKIERLRLTDGKLNAELEAIEALLPEAS